LVVIPEGNLLLLLDPVHNILHLGYLHIPVFSAFVAAGLVAALLLSQRTAPLANIPPDALWDTGMIAAISAFLISRLLLIAFNLHSFLAYPLLVLSLPSITPSGLALTALVTDLDLRRRHNPLLPTLDAAAPPLALLWTILSIGRFVTGSQGLPTHLPWAISSPLYGRIHPVELYTAAAALALCLFLCRALVLTHAINEKPGKTTATALFLAGAIAFFADFFTQPSDPVILLDPVQWLALAMIVASIVLALPHLAPQKNQEPHAL
jgi:phosphatidylglycerol:prolipoprotein diacylglycerol transferase